jgi:hypothetical protein
VILVTEPNAPAGWYDDPSSPGQQRYWDGVAWTEHLAPVPPAAADSPVGPAPAPANAREPFYKKWWVWAIAVLVIAIAAAGSGGSGTTKSQQTTPVANAPAATAPAAEQTAVSQPVAEEPVAPEPAPEPPVVSMTMGQEQAVAKGESYLEMAAFSRKGLIEQLVYEDFSKADATFAVDYIKPDWNEQAAKKAQSYIDMTSFSRQGLIDQLFYEGFTGSQAKFGVKAVGY